MQLIKYMRESDDDQGVDITCGVLWLLLIAAAVIIVTLSVRLIDTRNDLRMEREHLASIIIDNECVKQVTR